MSFASRLGLASAPGQIGPIPCLAPYYLFAHFMFAYNFLSTRGEKTRLGIDNNVAPREDLAIRGEAAVKAGKITRQQLNRLKRREAAHANAMENYALLVGALLSAQIAGLPNATINKAALAYTGARIVYAISYIYIENLALSFVRSACYWAGNISCLYLLWQSAKVTGSS